MLIKFVLSYCVSVLLNWTSYFDTDFASQMKFAKLPLIHLKHVNSCAQEHCNDFC